MTTRAHRYLFIPGVWSTLALLALLYQRYVANIPPAADRSLIPVFAIISLPMTLLWSSVGVYVLLKDRSTLRSRRAFLIGHICALLVAAAIISLRVWG